MLTKVSCVFTCNKPLSWVKIVYFLFYFKLYYSWTVEHSIHLDIRLYKTWNLSDNFT